MAMTGTTTAGVATVVDVDAAMDVDAVEAVDAALVEDAVSAVEAVSSAPTGQLRGRPSLMKTGLEGGAKPGLPIAPMPIRTIRKRGVICWSLLARSPR
ncbi:hypothetical protein XF35_15380 [Streptomyces platensis subsp. clarensis]|nr:hypothetical protein [Streptomyces platensis subsp. clarensis]